MATEQQVLQLTVNFSDEASAQIAQLRQALQQLSGGAAEQAHRRVRSETAELSKVFGDLAKEGAGLGKRFTEFSKAVGVLPLGFGVLGYELGRTIRPMQDWSKEVVQMGNAARMAGLGFAEFYNIVGQLQRGGIQDAGSLLTGFNRAFAEMMLLGSKRQQLLAMAGPGNAPAMGQFLLQLRQARTEVERINLVRRAGESVFQNTFDRTHDRIIANYNRQTFLEQFHAEQLANYTKDLTEQDVKRWQLREQMHDSAVKLNAAKSQEAKTREEIRDVMADMLAGPETKLIYMLIDVERDILRQIEALSKGKILPTWEEFTRGPGAGPTANESVEQRYRGIQDQPAVSNMTEAQLKAYGPLMRYGKQLARPMAEGGIVTQPTHALIGEAGPEAVIPLKDLNEHTEKVDANSDEVHQLNLNMDRMLSALEGPGGGRGGGTGAGGGGGGGGGPMFRPGIGPGATTPGGTTPAGTIAPPTPVTGPTGTPLAAVTGGQPFGINVSPERFSQITGLPSSFMNVSAGQRAYARSISTGAVSPPTQTTGLKPESSWPTVAATGAGTGGPGIIDRSKWSSYLAQNPQMKERILQIMNNEEGGSQEGMTAVAESIFNRADLEHRDLNSKRMTGWVSEGGYYADGHKGSGMDRAKTEAALAAALGGSDVSLGATENASEGRSHFASGEESSGKFKLRMVAGLGEHMEVPGYEGVGNARWQAWYDSVRRAPGTKDQSQVQGPQVVETLPSGAQVIRGAQTSAQVTGVPSEAVNALTHSGTTAINPTVLANAAELAKTGNTAAVNDYIRKQGLQVDQYDCAEFVSAIVKQSGGTVPKAYPAASSYLNYGQSVTGGLANAQPGDVLAKIHNRNTGGALSPGEGGGHAAMIGPEGLVTSGPNAGKVQIIQADPVAVRYVDPKNPGYWSDFRIGRADQPIDSTKVAGPPGATGTDPTDPFAFPGGAPENSADTLKRLNQISSGDPTVDRAALDKSPITAAKSNIKINIRHRNAPADVKASTDGPAFKGSTMERTNAPPTPPPKPAAEAPTKFRAGGLEFA